MFYFQKSNMSMHHQQLVIFLTNGRRHLYIHSWRRLVWALHIEILDPWVTCIFSPQWFRGLLFLRFIAICLIMLCILCYSQLTKKPRHRDGACYSLEWCLHQHQSSKCTSCTSSTSWFECCIWHHGPWHFVGPWSFVKPWASLVTPLCG